MNHDRIYLFNSKNTFLDLTVGKKWVTESYTDETQSTMMYYATLGQKLAPKWDTWVGYYREDRTSNLYDLGKHSNYETNYRWTHRFCCWAIEFEYEQDHRKDHGNTFRVRYNFLNW